MKNLLLGVAYDDESNTYSVDIAQGSNVAETAFSVVVVVKCLVRDKVIDKPEVFLEMLNKYLIDPQYEELKENEESNNEGENQDE